VGSSQKNRNLIGLYEIKQQTRLQCGARLTRIVFIILCRVVFLVARRSIKTLFISGLRPSQQRVRSWVFWRVTLYDNLPPWSRFFPKLSNLSNKLSVVTGHKANIRTIHDCKDIYCSFLLHTAYLYLHLMYKGMKNRTRPGTCSPILQLVIKRRRVNISTIACTKSRPNIIQSPCLTLTENGTSDYKQTIPPNPNPH